MADISAQEVGKALIALQKRLAPDGSNARTVRFLPTQPGGSVFEIKNPGTGLNAIVASIQSGKIHVFFGPHTAPAGGYTSTAQLADADWTFNITVNPLPIPFIPTNCSVLTFVIDPQAGPATGTMQIQFY